MEAHAEQEAARTVVCERPVFIIGSPRSGTSALAWALAEHDAFWTSGETDFFYHLFGQGRLHEMWVACGGGTTTSWMAKNGVSRAEFAASMGFGLNALLTRRSAGKRWIDQSPTYTAMVGELAVLLPDALFVHIMRDGRNVVHSMINTGFDALWATDFTEACRTWAWFVEQSVAFGEREPDRYLAVPHEFLSENPVDCFAGLYDFLDVEYAEEPVEFARSRRINSSFQPDGPMDEKHLAPPQPWKTWTAEQRKIFAEEAGRVFVEHGFGTERDLAT